MRRSAPLALTALLACGPTDDGAPAPADPAREEATPSPSAQALLRLRAFEARERAATDFAALPSAATSLGADPYALVALDATRAVGILRGSGEVVLYDGELRALSHASLAGPTGLAACAGEVLVVGELESSVARFRVVDDRLQAEAALEVPGAVALRDVACAGDRMDVIDEARDLLTTFRHGVARSVSVCEGPVEVRRADDRVLVRCAIDHTVMVLPLDEDGMPQADRAERIQHDGPMWSMLPWRDGGGQTWLALGGVEDHPLDRSEGFFGHIDSFVFLYRLTPAPELVATRNVAADGVVTPKVLLRDDAGLVVAGYGSSGAVVLDDALALVGRRPFLPGGAAVTRFGDRTVSAHPLLDAWVMDGQTVVAERAPANPEQRLGEALAFTTLMAPHNPSDGSHSRFTCETCHLEGYGDGRIHRTGRGDVVATTKPLYGLFNNRPHFTRALDPDLTRIAHAEFGVAGRGSDTDPWFALSQAEHPWLALLEPSAASLEPEGLRRALMVFLMAFNHRPNPMAERLGAFGAEERAGASSFRDHCVGCHAARLSTDDAATEVPFEAWERHIFGGGAIVWARPGYELTGVTPYVHEAGARPSSLRRLYRKRPYFTNGSARSLAEVVARVGFDGERFFHDRAPAGARRLSAAEQKALVSFLRLL